jgi:hypothetical protein
MKKLEEIFDIKNSQSLELINCEQIEKGICFVSRTSANNGIVARIKQLDELEPMSPNAITVALGGSVLSSFYQEEPFYTAFHIACLYPKKDLTKVQMLYYAYVIEQNKYRYNYGRQANKTLKTILVPDINELPKYISDISINDYKFEKEPVLKKKIELNVENWQKIKLKDIFDIFTSSDKNYLESEDGNIPYISSTQFNNGISSFVQADTIENKNTITVARNGSVGSAFYHSYNYCASPDDVRILMPKFEMDKYIAIFLCTLIEKEKYRYTYGRKFGTERMRETEIKLPFQKNGSPDWQFISDYIKFLPYSNYI